MIAKKSGLIVGRRAMLMGAASLTATSTLAMPYIARAAEPIKIGLLLAKTGQIASQTEYLANGSYLALEERSGIARRLKADLFLSIHADSADSDKASGATVYTLSARGSSEEATHIAASENRADSVNGVTLGATTNDVSAILVDLSQRRTGQLSDDFARVILREGQGRIVFRERPLQSAAFVVLKSPDLPSVLFEAGYISNGHDAQRLASPGGQRAFADMTAQAIRVYFARQLAQAGPG